MEKKKIAVVFGTRPEAIKMAPVILEFKKNNDFFETIVIVTAQHREMLDQVLSVFKITPDYDLDLMKKNQSLSDITSNVLKRIESIFIDENPDLVLVHGDTTTSFSAALAAFYQGVLIGHIESGLRTNDKNNPFPEEANRQLIDTLSDFYFVPTEAAKFNLLQENKDENKISVTGNTVIDAMNYTRSLPINHDILDKMHSEPEKKWIVLTMHRRENYGQPMINVFQAILKLVDNDKSIKVILPVHMSPYVQTLTEELLSSNDSIHLIDPLDVDIFHKVIEKSTLVLTDSGGLQEEAPAFNIPVLVLRDKTERPEGVESGTLKIIGTQSEEVYSSVMNLLNNKSAYDKMSKSINPYGDGTSSKKIVEFIKEYFT